MTRRTLIIALDRALGMHGHQTEHVTCNWNLGGDWNLCPLHVRRPVTSTTRAGVSNSQLYTLLVAMVAATPGTHFLTSRPDHVGAQETVEVLILVNHCDKGLVTGKSREFGAFDSYKEKSVSHRQIPIVLSNVV